MAKRYDVIIRTSLDSKLLKAGEREAVSTFDRIKQKGQEATKQAIADDKARLQSFQNTLRQIDRMEQGRLTVAKQVAREIEREEKQLSATMIREAKAAQRIQEQASRQRAREEQQTAREIQRINAQTTRQAEQQAKQQEKIARDLERNKQRLIKQEQDAFLRAEAVKTSAARAAADAQVAAAAKSKAAWIAAWGTIKVAALAAFAGILSAAGILGVAISRAMSMDALQKALTVVVGSVDKTAAHIKNLREIAKLPGIGFREALDGAIRMNVGLATVFTNVDRRIQVTESLLRGFANAVALSGGGKAELDRITLQIGQMASAGKILTADLRPILQAAPAVGSALQKAFGTVNAKEIEGMGLSMDQFFERLLGGLTSLPAATNSTKNAWDNFTDSLDIALVTLGKPFLEPLTRALDALSPLLQEAADKASALFTMIGEDAVKLWANLPAATKAAFADMLATVEGVGGQVVEWFKQNYPLIQEAVTNALNQIAEFWRAHGADIKELVTNQLQGLLEVVRLILLGIKGDWKEAWGSLHLVVARQAGALQGAVTLLVKMVLHAMEASRPLVVNLAKSLGEAVVDGAAQGILNKAGHLAEVVANTFTGIPNLVRGLWAIKSPSRVFITIGEQAMEGLNLGIQVGALKVQQTLADVLDLTAGKFTKAPKKPAEAAAKQIAKILRDQAEALRDIGGKESAIDRMNRLLADPSIAKRIDERTASILRMSAAMQDAAGLTRERTVIGRPRVVNELDWLMKGSTRERTVGPDPATRVRSVTDPVDLELARTYSGIIDDLNSKLQQHTRLTQVEITLQQLQRAGLGDLTDARAQEALAVAAQIDRETELNKTRDKIADFAGNVSDIFGRAIDDWDGSFKDFFSSVKQGFGDMLRRMVADLVSSALFSTLKNFLQGIFNVRPGQSAGLGSILGGGGGALTGGFAGGPGGGGLLSGLLSSFGGGITAPAASSAMGGGLAGIGEIFSGGVATGVGGISAKGSLSGVAGLGGLAGIIPLLGAGLGVGLGGSSRTGQILGGLGGAAAGIAGIAGMAAFGVGGSSVGALAGSLGILGPAAAIAAPFLIAGAIILAKNAARRRDEKTRNEISGNTGTAIWALIDQARSLGLAGATTQWNAIKANYFSQIAAIKDGKTRRNAELQWQNDFLPLWKIVETRAMEGEKAKKATEQFVPTFARGAVFNSDFFIPRASRGLLEIPGMFDKRDDLLMRVSRGERVAVMTPEQFDRVGGRRTFQNAGVPALANGGFSTPSTANSSRSTVPTITLEQSFSIDAKGMVTQVLKSPDGYNIVVNSVRKNIREQDEIIGDVKQNLITGR